METTPLMSVEETLKALAKSKEIGYRRPGEQPATSSRGGLATMNRRHRADGLLAPYSPECVEGEFSEVQVRE